MNQPNIEAAEPNIQDARFTAVADAFASVVSHLRTGGASMAVWHDGREVLSTAAGTADHTGRPWTTSTPSMMFSISKGLSSLVVAYLEQQGTFSYDQEVASIWPEFADYGKDKLTIGDLLAHRAGLPALEGQLTPAGLADHSTLAARLAEQEPLWQPGSKWLYHPVTWGPLVQEIVVRTTGRTVGAHFDELIGKPLGVDVAIEASPEMAAKAVHLTRAPMWWAVDAYVRTIARNKVGVAALTMGGALPPGLITKTGGFNDPVVRTAGLPSATAIGTASGVAQIWSSIIAPAHGESLLSEQQIQRLCAVRSTGPTFTSDKTPYGKWGAGVELSSTANPWLSSSSFGHNGAGGQIAFADPTHRIGFAFLTNRMGTTAGNKVLEVLRETVATLP